MKVRFKKLNEKAVMPTKAHATDAGFDLVATSREVDENGNVVYGTGIAVEIPEGYVGLIFPRSSICKKDLVLTNSVGCVDAGYRGEIMAKFKTIVRAGFIREEREGELYLSKTICISDRIYKVGDRIAQLIIMPIPQIEFEETDQLTDTDRGTGGYGSTGK